MKKLISAALACLTCATVLFTGVASLSASAANNTTPNIQIPSSAFITKDDILGLCEEYEYGLLASGSVTDTVIRINFGYREETFGYYYDSSQKTVNAGSITWLVTGSDAQESIVLYSEEPIIGANSLKSYGKYDSRFQTSIESELDYETDFGTYTSAPTTVGANHWGASSLREALSRMYSDTSAFSTIERSLMNKSTVSNIDYKNGSVTYFTDDFLYVPNVDMTFGSDDGIMLSSNYVKSMQWLRNPCLSTAPNNYVGVNSPDYYGGELSDMKVTVDDPAVNAAFRLNLNSVSFASSASAANAMGYLYKLSDDAPLTLRMNTPKSPLVGAYISATGTSIQYTVPTGARLMAVITDEDGNTYQYCKYVSGTGAFDLSGMDLNGYFDESMQYVGKAWLETDVSDGGSVTYATETVDVFNLETKPSWGEEFERADGVVQYVNDDGITSVELSTENLDSDGFLWIEESAHGITTRFGIDLSYGAYELDKGSRFFAQVIEEGTRDHNRIEKSLDKDVLEKIQDDRVIMFRVGLEDADGNELQTNSAVTNVYVQIGIDWNPEDVKAYAVYNIQDENISATCKLEDYAIVSINDITAYHIMFDELTERDSIVEPEGEKLPLNPDVNITYPDDYKEPYEDNTAEEKKFPAIVGIILGVIVAAILGGIILLVIGAVILVPVVVVVAVGVAVPVIILIVKKKKSKKLE